MLTAAGRPGRARRRSGDKDLARSRLGREPRRDVDRVAHRGQLRVGPLTHGTDERDTGVDADADPDPRLLGASVSGHLEQPLRGFDRMASVLPTGVGRDEDADHLVADEFVDDRVEVDQRGKRLIVEAAHQGSELGRAHALGEGGRASDVREEQRAVDLSAAVVGQERSEAALAVLRVLRPASVAEIAEHPAAGRPERRGAHLAAWWAGNSSMSAAEANDAGIGAEQQATPDFGLGREVAVGLLVRWAHRDNGMREGSQCEARSPSEARRRHAEQDRRRFVAAVHVPVREPRWERDRVALAQDVVLVARPTGRGRPRGRRRPPRPSRGCTAPRRSRRPVRSSTGSPAAGRPCSRSGIRRRP